MKKYKLVIFPILILFIFSCTKMDLITPTDFTISVDKTTYKVGDTVTFKINGNPDYIHYFSGDSGYIYENRNLTTAPIGKVTMSFSSRLTEGATDSTLQQNTLRVLISGNFITPAAGYKIDSAAVARTSMDAWEDITSRFKLPKVPGTNSLNTGVVDITDLAIKYAGKPTYLAFLYKDVSDTVQAQRYWYITNLTIDNTLPNGNKYNVFYLINKSLSPLFSIVNIKNNSNIWTIGSTAAQISINGGPAKSPDNEDWIISRALNLMYFTTDKSLPIKTVSDNIITSTQKIYKKAGVYHVVFVAKNVINGNETEVIRDLNITVTN